MLDNASLNQFQEQTSLANSMALKGALNRIYGDRYSQDNSHKYSAVWDNYDDSYTDGDDVHENYDPDNDDAFD